MKVTVSFQLLLFFSCCLLFLLSHCNSGKPRRLSTDEAETRFNDKSIQQEISIAKITHKSQDVQKYLYGKSLEYRITDDKYEFHPGPENDEYYLERPFFCKNEFDVEVSPDDASFTFMIDLVIDNKQNKVATVDILNLSTSPPYGGWEAYSSPSPEPTPCLDGSAPQAR
jgi:hypothetical protein